MKRVKSIDIANDPYKWPKQGAGLQRFLRPGRGMYHDVQRRLPFYWSDVVDGLNYRTFAGTIRIYFVNLLPALAFTLDMYNRTDGFFGINEGLLSSLMAAVVFSILSCQPLTVVGITGLISLFNYTIWDIVKIYDRSVYPQVMVWVGIWSAIFHWLTAIWNLCDYMRTVTDFSSSTFALYVGTIYIIKGIEELAIGFNDEQYLNGFASCLVAILYTFTIWGLEKLRETTIIRPFFRGLLGDYAYPIATLFWTGFVHIPGNLARVHFEFLPVNKAFYPTVDRPWVVDFWNLSVGWIFVAAPFGFLMTLLFYYDHNVSSLTAQARHFPLIKPAGFHWDFFLLGCTCFGAGILNIPLPNGLVPQAPVHTDGLTTYEETAREINTTATSNDEVPPVIVEKVTTAVHVAEQRLSHFFMALAFLGTMTGPLLVVLNLMPRAIFSGVFFIVGWGSIAGNDILLKIHYLIQEPRFRQPHHPLNRVKKSQVVHFVGWQIFGWAATIAISQTIGAIGFPVLIIGLIPLRWVLFPRLFTAEELSIMDHLTATGEVVHVSLGGIPEMPERELQQKSKKSDPEQGDSDSSEPPLDDKNNSQDGTDRASTKGLRRPSQQESLELRERSNRAAADD